jgi:hypothetical protein
MQQGTSHSLNATFRHKALTGQIDDARDAAHKQILF